MGALGSECFCISSKASSFVTGKYYRPDLNFPVSLPNRKDSIKNFECDPPLTCCGIFQSRLIGKLFKEAKFWKSQDGAEQLQMWSSSILIPFGLFPLASLVLSLSCQCLMTCECICFCDYHL